MVLLSSLERCCLSFLLWVFFLPPSSLYVLVKHFFDVMDKSYIYIYIYNDGVTHVNVRCQHECQAFVGSNVLLCKPARMRVALFATTGILSALALLLTKETVFPLSEYRQASERQELAHDSTCPIVIFLQPEVADLDFEFPFLCGLDTGVLVALAVIFRRCQN